MKRLERVTKPFRTEGDRNSFLPQLPGADRNFLLVQTFHVWLFSCGSFAARGKIQYGKLRCGVCHLHRQIMKPQNLFSIFCICFCLLAGKSLAQRVAVLIPEKPDRDVTYVEQLGSALKLPIRLLDLAQSTTAFRSLDVKTPYNMTAAESRAAASVMGCEYFLILRTGRLRRQSFSKPDYYESFAVSYLVSGRTGLLVGWWLKSFEADNQANADRQLAASIDITAAEIAGRMKSMTIAESRVIPSINIEEVPDETSPAALGLKPPIPYRRIKPEYTSTAALYDVKATVDLEADIDADGKILATRILRWAGFGLDESAESAVRSMSWRPAMRNGKALPMRILLRYNFTKLDKQ